MHIRHIFCATLHPQTIGKFERLNRTAKVKLGLIIYTSSEELEEAVACFYHWYNHQRYHEALGNLRPVDVYRGVSSVSQKRRLNSLRLTSFAEQPRKVSSPNRANRAARYRMGRSGAPRGGSFSKWLK